MTRTVTYSNQTGAEDAAQAFLEDLMRSYVFGSEVLRNLPLFLRQKDLAHILFMAEIYQKIVDVPGYVAEFGVMWGRNLALLQGLRECFEPYNHTRRILGFDTFTGLPEAAPQDRGGENRSRAPRAPGAYAVPAGYEDTLRAILSRHQSTAHLAHAKRCDVIKGDVEATLPRWLERNPHALFALCCLDLDLYRPTKAVLEALRGRLVRGAVLVFDEILNPDYPGETRAVSEVLGVSTLRLRRSALSGWKTYAVLGAE